MASPSKPRGKKGGKPPVFDGLPADALEHVALLLPVRDRFKLNLVCRAWRAGLAGARQVWEELTVDPRKKACTSRRVRLKKHLPTPEALESWFSAYGRHVRRLHLRNLDATSAAEGCVGEAGLAALLAGVAQGLQQLTVQHCRVQDLLSLHAGALATLQQLTSLHFQLHPHEGGLSLGTPQTAFITCLSGLQDLAIASGWRDAEHFLPASLAALPALRSLQLARLGGERGVFQGAADVYSLTVASCLTGLTALQRLLLSDFLLMEEEPPAGEIPDELRVPPSLWGLPGLTSLLLNDIGLGRQAPAGPHSPPNAQGLYPLPAEIRSLAGTLRDVSLLQHTCTPQELAALAALTGLTALALAARLRARPTPVPDALSCLTGLAQLRISHGLTQVPPAIVGLTGLTLLDLSYNSLHSLKPGPYLKRLVAVNLRANAFTHFPPQLRVARHTAVELQLPQNAAMEITERDLEQLLTFECLRQLTIYGASEDKGTRRCLAALQKAMPWLLIDV